MQLSSAGGRLIIASDGVWDALNSDKAAKCCRGLLQSEVAAKHIVKVRMLLYNWKVSVVKSSVLGEEDKI